MSGNPQPGSTIEIEYEPKSFVLEVAALREFIQGYVGGKGDIRSMEGMIDDIAISVSEVLKVSVHVRANLKLLPEQDMVLHFYAWK